MAIHGLQQVMTEPAAAHAWPGRNGKRAGAAAGPSVLMRSRWRSVCLPAQEGGNLDTFVARLVTVIGCRRTMARGRCGPLALTARG